MQQLLSNIFIVYVWYIFKRYLNLYYEVGSEIILSVTIFFI